MSKRNKAIQALEDALIENYTAKLAEPDVDPQTLNGARQLFESLRKVEAEEAEGLASQLSGSMKGLAELMAQMEDDDEG